MIKCNLTEIMEYAIDNGFKVDDILDAYNRDPEMLQLQYMEMKSDPYNAIANEVYNKGDYLVDAKVMKALDEIKSKKTNNNMVTRDDVRAMKKVVNSLKNKVDIVKEDKGVRVDVAITSVWSDHREFDSIYFPGAEDTEEEGILNAVDAIVSEMSYLYLING